MLSYFECIIKYLIKFNLKKTLLNRLTATRRKSAAIVYLENRGAALLRCEFQ